MAKEGHSHHDKARHHLEQASRYNEHMKKHHEKAHHYMEKASHEAGKHHEKSMAKKHHGHHKQK